MITEKFKLFIKELIGKSIDISNTVEDITKDKFYIFSFHEITDNPSIFQKKNKLFVSKKVFKNQINFIKKLFTIIEPDKLYYKKNIKNSALITFDDGYHNSFKYGLNILNKLKINPIFFLNMSAIKNQTPLLPASIEYLELNFKNFNNYINKFNISKPISLSIKPDQFNYFEKYISLKRKKINRYQGKLINFSFLKSVHKNKKFYIADHLYEHYNCLALNKKELDKLVKKNNKILKNFHNFIKFFSFPNGVPKTCFNKANVNWIKKLNYIKAFSNGNKTNINSKKFLLDRISLNNEDNTYNKFLFKIYRAKNN